MYGNDVSFSAADFEKALGVKSVKYVTFSTLPDPKDGVLWLSNLRISEGQTVKASNLELLRFSPASEITTEASFTFLCDDYGGGAPLRCDIRMAVMRPLPLRTATLPCLFTRRKAFRFSGR